jgi:SM-20-related protein
MESSYETLITSFIDNRVGICDHFLSAALAGCLQQNLIRLDHANKMQSAGIGNDPVKDSKQNKRGDKIYWIENNSKEPAEREFLDQVEAFIVHLNNSCYTRINDYEFHYALYETGSSYKRHVDQFKNNVDRKFSLINYLNTDWKVEEGGELSIFHEGMVEKILPNLQKAVFFKSDISEHEVSVSTRPRMSITGWLKSCQSADPRHFIADEIIKTLF